MHLKTIQYAEMVKIYRSGIVEKYKLNHMKMVSFGFYRRWHYGRKCGGRRTNDSGSRKNDCFIRWKIKYDF